MKTFVLHWLDGKNQDVTGKNIADAMNNAGYGHGALRALDYYEEKKSPPNPVVQPIGAQRLIAIR